MSLSLMKNILIRYQSLYICQVHVSSISIPFVFKTKDKNEGSKCSFVYFVHRNLLSKFYIVSPIEITKSCEFTLYVFTSIEIETMNFNLFIYYLYLLFHSKVQSTLF